jgi:BlaI family transcriptional regulator, penicillinase repressor
MEPIRELTKSELQIMNVIWDKKKTSVYEILEEFQNPKMAYSTASTFVRILVSKGYVGFEPNGKSYLYFPLISRETYMDSFMAGVKDSFFKGSFKSMISFFAKKENLTQSQFDSILTILNENKKKTD